MPTDEPDSYYVREVRNGNTDAFRVLVDRYKRLVFSLTNQYGDVEDDSEDLAQEVFMSAFQKIDDLRDPDQFSSWLYGIALNRCRDYARNVRRETRPFSEFEEDEDHLAGEAESTTDAQLDLEQESARLWDAISQLPANYATPLLLKYRDGLSYKAMSGRLGVSVSALKVRVHRARKKIRKLLND